MSLESLVDTYCAAWSETDPDRRAQLLAAAWAAGATYTDPLVEALDVTALQRHIERIQATRPGARVVRSGPVEAHHGHARFAFQVVAADGAVLREGTDFVDLTQDGRRIARIVGFFALPPAS